VTVVVVVACVLHWAPPPWRVTVWSTGLSFEAPVSGISLGLADCSRGSGFKWELGGSRLPGALLDQCTQWSPVLVTDVKRWSPVWTRISCDAAVGLGKCITGRDFGMRGIALGAVLCPLRLAMSWPVKEGLEPHSLLTIGGGWHLQEMQLAALLDMGLRCDNVMGWKACLAHVLLCFVWSLHGPDQSGIIACGTNFVLHCTHCLQCLHSETALARGVWTWSSHVADSS
jgi:hypothetical protein